MWVSLLSAAIGTVLVVAGLSKIVSRLPFEGFLAAIGVPMSLATWLARSIPIAELLIGAALISAISREIAGTSAFVLCSGFVVAHVWANWRGVHQHCRCFGVLDEELSSSLAIVRASFLLAASATFVVGDIVLPSSAAGGSSVGTTTVAGIAVGVAYVFTFALLGELLSFERRRPRAVRAPALSPPPTTE